jgi:adenosylcobinamide-phosphate synthase
MVLMLVAVALGVAVENIGKSRPMLGQAQLLALVVWVYLLKCTFAIRELIDAGLRVALWLERNDLSGARQAVRSLVSRDVSGLDRGRVASAAVESLAENLCDSVVAPLLFYVLFGLPGALAYRVANTLDAMYGYRGELEWAGKVAARVDDVLNFVPARLSSLGLWLVSSAVAGLEPLRAAWKYRRLTESPNAGWTMSALAGALGVTLEKPGHYIIPGGPQYPDRAHLLQACRIVFRAAVLFAAVAIVGGLLSAFI